MTARWRSSASDELQLEFNRERKKKGIRGRRRRQEEKIE